MKADFPCICPSESMGIFFLFVCFLRLGKLHDELKKPYRLPGGILEFAANIIYQHLAAC